MRGRKRICGCAAAVLALLWLSTPGAHAQSRLGSVHGRVLDLSTQEVVPGAYVRLREMGRNELSHADGTFHFEGLNAGTYTVVAQRLGYAPGEAKVVLAPGETVQVVVQLRSSALEIAGIVVTGTGRERRADETYRPTTVLSDAELRRHLEGSVAATLSHVPGISQQYNGPAASQPVVRGMGGDRVLVLEDGQRTGDMATTGGDHAVTIDPLTAKRLEVVRGPASLLYGSNALGGVINVIREEVPRSLPERITGMASVQGESVNRGLAGGGSVALPLGRVSLRTELGGRAAGDTRTPEGVLESSQVGGAHGGVGAGLVTGWGHIGAAFRLGILDYGVPGQFAGQAIPGAHEGGITIETLRHTGRVEVQHHSGLGPFRSVELESGYAHYQHDEIEGRLQTGQPVVGARFDQLSGTGSLVLRHQHDLHPLLSEGAIGVSMRGRDLRASGGFTGSRDAREWSFAGYVFEEMGFRPLRVQVGARYDQTHLQPLDTRPIVFGEDEMPVRAREFEAFSGSVAVLSEVWTGWTAGVSVARAFRTPSVEELFSNGPHLADFSYNVGNPELAAEFGAGVDVFVRVSRPGLRAEMTAYRNSVDNYIYYMPTGDLDPRFSRYPVFQARGDDALFQGVEGRVQWETVPGLVLDGTAAYVRASRRREHEPLPSIPPLNGRLETRYEAAGYFVQASWRAAAEQRRVPAAIVATEGDEPFQPQLPTPGHSLLDLGGGFRWVSGGRLHTLTLQIDNLLDTAWRDHLSRLKEVAPQPGRNVRALYRVQF